jgi:hypothetical protein
LFSSISSLCFSFSIFSNLFSYESAFCFLIEVPCDLSTWFIASSANYSSLPEFSSSSRGGLDSLTVFLSCMVGSKNKSWSKYTYFLRLLVAWPDLPFRCVLNSLLKHVLRFLQRCWISFPV